MAMSSYDFVESVVTSALIRTSSAGPPTRRRVEAKQPAAAPSPYFRPSSASSAISTVSTHAGGPSPVPASSSRATTPPKAISSAATGGGIGRHLLEPMALSRPAAGGTKGGAGQDTAPAVNVSIETALLYCECNALLQQAPAAISRLARSDTLASRSMLQMLWIVLATSSIGAAPTSPSSKGGSGNDEAPNESLEQRRLLAELTNPSLLLQLTASADGQSVDAARRSALGGGIAVERTVLAPEVLKVDLAVAKDAMDRATAAYQQLCTKIHEGLVEQQHGQDGGRGRGRGDDPSLLGPANGDMELSAISIAGSDVCLPPVAAGSSMSRPPSAPTHHHQHYANTSSALQLIAPPAIADADSAKLLALARAKWAAQLAYGRALERCALVQFVEGTASSIALRGMADAASTAAPENITSSFDAKKVLDVLRQRAAEITQQVRTLQRRPSATGTRSTKAPDSSFAGGAPNTRMITASPTLSPASEVPQQQQQQPNADHRLTQLLLERDAMRQATAVVERCLKEQRQFLERIETDRRAFVQARVVEEQMRKTLQDEAMLRAQVDTSLRRRVVALDEELQQLQTALAQARQANGDLQRHIAAVRVGAQLASDEGRPVSASSLHIMVHPRKGRLTDDEQQQQLARLVASPTKAFLDRSDDAARPTNSRSSVGRLLTPPPLHVCERCEAKRLAADAATPKLLRSSPQRKLDGATDEEPHAPLLLSELNEKLYYSRKDKVVGSHSCARAQKLLDRHLSELDKNGNNTSGGGGPEKKTSYSRDEVGAIVQRLYIEQVQHKEAMQAKLFELHVASKEVPMPKRAADEIDGIVARLAKAME